MSRSRGSDSTITTDRTVPGLISRYGIVPNVIQILAPDEYARNEAYEESLEGGGGPRPYPSDPDIPDDPRSDPLALTPMYRNGQREWFQVLDAYSDHSMNDPHGTGYPSWDGTVFPIYSPTSLTPAEKEQYRKDWYNYVFPGYNYGTGVTNYYIRGMKQLYDEVQPFADPLNPTVAEFENWNNEILNLFRRISGMPAAVPLQELFIMSAWSRERKTTSIWDSKYPGTFDSAYGPCLGGSNLHCGTTFKPSVLDDQIPYWNEYYVDTKTSKPSLITLNQGTEALTVWYNGNVSHAMARNLHHLMRSAGTGVAIGGHAGPFAARQYYGIVHGRSKWAGTLYQPPSGYSY